MEGSGGLQHKQLLFATLEYLSRLAQGVYSDAQPAVQDSESLEVAIQCLGAAFGLDLQNEQQRTELSVPLDLPQIFGMGLAGKEKITEALSKLLVQQPPEQEGRSTSKEGEQNEETEANVDETKFQAFVSMLEKQDFFRGTQKGDPEYTQRLKLARQKFVQKFSSSAQSPPAVDQQPPPPSTEQVIQAEAFKNKGNEKLSSGELAEALSLYSKAIQLNPCNAIYYSNRAAVHSRLGQHEQAIQDCEKAIAIDPKYSKAYSRLGFALFSLERYEEAIAQGYNKALELDPDNTANRESLELCKEKLASSQQAQTQGFGGLESLLQNPELQQMAQQFASQSDQGGTPNLGDLLQNPNLVNMAQQFMSSPSFAQLMNNPTMMNMAQNMMRDPSALGNLFGQMGSNMPQAGPTRDSTTDEKH